jgi:hypothetical protein
MRNLKAQATPTTRQRNMREFVLFAISRMITAQPKKKLRRSAGVLR